MWLLLALFGLALPLAAATIEVGAEGDVMPEKVERLNQTGPAGAPAPGGKPQAAPVVPEAGGFTRPDYWKPIRDAVPQVVKTAVQALAAPKRPNAGMDRVLQPPTTGPIELTGKGSKEIIAVADGPVKIETYLSTYNPANMKVQLLDADGSEVWFNGRSLLLWERRDDKSYAPVYFRGNADSNSMYQNGPGDYSPKTNLSYSFDIKKGQKLILQTGGQALSKSFIRVKSSAF